MFRSSVNNWQVCDVITSLKSKYFLICFNSKERKKALINNNFLKLFLSLNEEDLVHLKDVFWKGNKKKEDLKMAPLFLSAIILFILCYTNAKNYIKEDFCEAKTFNQAITYEGCEVKYIKNNLCRGQCNSTFTPSFTHSYIKCAACRPTNPGTGKISLKCKDGKTHEATVQLYQFCQCTIRSCNKINRIIRRGDLMRENRPRTDVKIRMATLKKGTTRKLSSRRKRRCRRKKGVKKKGCLRRWRKEKKRKRRQGNLEEKIKKAIQLNLFAFINDKKNNKE